MGILSVSRIAGEKMWIVIIVGAVLIAVIIAKIYATEIARMMMCRVMSVVALQIVVIIVEKSNAVAIARTKMFPVIIVIALKNAVNAVAVRIALAVFLQKKK
jgi:hypothetical protein